MPSLAFLGVQPATQRTSSQTPKGPVPVVPETESCLRTSHRDGPRWALAAGLRGGEPDSLWAGASLVLSQALGKLQPNPSGARPAQGARGESADCSHPSPGDSLLPPFGQAPDPALAGALGSLLALSNLPPSGEQGRPGSTAQLTSPTLSLPVSLK